MKNNFIVFILLIIISYQILAKNTIKLLTPITQNGLKKVYGKLVIKDKVIELIGKSETVAMPRSNEKAIQILWTEVKNNSKKKYLQKPILMTFITSGISKNVELQFIERKKDVELALENLSDVPSVECVDYSKFSSKRYINNKLHPITMMSKHSDVSNKKQYKHPLHEMSEPKQNVSYEYSKEVMTEKVPLLKNANLNSHSYANNNSRVRTSNEIGSNVGNDAHNLVFGNRPISYSKEKDDTRIEVSTRGCQMRIDYNNKRAIVQNKIYTYKKNNIVKESDCTDSSEFYLIKKDYSCEDCKDFIDMKGMKVYSTFKYYYTNNEGEKVVLSADVRKDKKNIFKIISDKDCPPAIDLEGMKAYPQKKLVYIDRENNKKVVKMCHKSDAAIPIKLTYQGCIPTHDYDNKWRIPKQKGVFVFNGQEHVAFSCKEFGNPIRHQYDLKDCSNNVNLPGGRIALMGRKYVLVDGKKMYLSECEPIGQDHLLMETNTGCENSYEHCILEGRSYIKKRWYYLEGIHMRYITQCIKSSEYLAHKVDITGYEYDDMNKTAKRITTVYIEPNRGSKISIKENYIDPNIEPVPYQFQKRINEPTSSYTYEGCFRLTHTNKYSIYKRPDGTMLKQFEGFGTPKKSKNLCKSIIESKDVYHHTHIFARNWENKNETIQWDSQDKDMVIYTKVSSLVKVNMLARGMYGVGFGSLLCSRYFSVYSRKVIHYPSGFKVYLDWKNTGKIVKRGEYWANHDNSNYFYDSVHKGW